MMPPSATPATALSEAMVADLLGRDPADSSWRQSGLCTQTDPDLFFPDKGKSAKSAKTICAHCEVRPQCLAYALDRDERFGVWGGLSERERRRLTRPASASASPAAARRAAA